jgi:hypothetical protein
MKSIRYDRGRSLCNIHDKKSIYISVAHDRGLRAPIKEFTTRILRHIASKLRSSKPPGIQLSPGIFLWVELVQVLNVPGVQDILTLRIF